MSSSLTQLFQYDISTTILKKMFVGMHILLVSMYILLSHIYSNQAELKPPKMFISSIIRIFLRYQNFIQAWEWLCLIRSITINLSSKFSFLIIDRILPTKKPEVNIASLFS